MHHDAFMRTTLTLDPEVHRLAEAIAHRSHRPFKAVVNDALRLGLGTATKGIRPKLFRVRASPLGLRAGLDASRLNQLADEIETDALAAKVARRPQR
jgi:hypothetical protein